VVDNITPAEFSAWPSERFTAKKGHGLGFDLGHTAGRVVGVGKVCLLAVQEAMSYFVEKRLLGRAARGLMAILPPRRA
jgi:hypothetical protein